MLQHLQDAPRFQALLGLAALTLVVGLVLLAIAGLASFFFAMAAMMLFTGLAMFDISKALGRVLDGRARADLARKT